MQIDINKIINQIPDTLKSSSRPRRVRSSVVTYQLGDKKRFEKLPNKVNKEFIALYKDDLDEFLVPYIQQGELTVRKAHNFIERMVDQIFGTQDYYGIFSYLKERNYENESDKELVRTCERLLNSGWLVRKDNNTNRYKLYNSEGSIVLDVTGRSEFYEESASTVIDENSAHLFIESSVASRVESLSRKVGMSADDLKEMDSIESLLIHTEDKELTGYIKNYTNLKTILSRLSSYKTFTRGTTTNDLYLEGYTLGSQLFRSDNHKTLLNKGKNSYIIYSVTPEINQIYNVNKDLLSVLASRIKNDLFKNISLIKFDELTEVKEFERVFALMIPYVDNDLVHMSYADMSDFFSRLDSYVKSGEISTRFYNTVVRSFAQVVVTESILLGNNWFSLSNFSMDTVSGKVHLYNNKDPFTSKIEDLKNFINLYEGKNPSSRDVFSPYLDQVFPFRFSNQRFTENIHDLIESLPSEYFVALSALEISFEGYGLEFSAIKEYINEAKTFLMSRA